MPTSTTNVSAAAREPADVPTSTTTKPATAPVRMSSRSTGLPAANPGPSKMVATATGTMPTFADAKHLRGAVEFHRDGIKVSRLIMPAGSELPVHTVPDDLVIVVLRGKGIVYAQQEPRHVEAGSVIDLVPGEQHSIDCFDEMELVITQMSLASRQAPLPPPPPAG